MLSGGAPYGNERCSSERRPTVSTMSNNQGFEQAQNSQLLPQGCLTDSPGTDFETHITVDGQTLGEDDFGNNMLSYQEEICVLPPETFHDQSFGDEDELHQNWDFSHDSRMMSRD